MCVLQVISRCVEDGLVLPVFKNLVKLYFGSNNKRGWKLLPYLIKQTPKLETLIIQVSKNTLNEYLYTVTDLLCVDPIHASFLIDASPGSGGLRRQCYHSSLPSEGG